MSETLSEALNTFLKKVENLIKQIEDMKNET